VNEEYFWGQTRSPPTGGAPQYPKFCDLLHARTQYEKQQLILHGDQTECEESFYTVDQEC